MRNRTYIFLAIIILLVCFIVYYNTTIIISTRKGVNFEETCTSFRGKGECELLMYSSPKYFLHERKWISYPYLNIIYVEDLK